jgi:molybdopterin/thiamine biosynthesis adenylyltransferase/rhodanese-related sulfurtransferase
VNGEGETRKRGGRDTLYEPPGREDALRPAEIARYQRQMVLPELGLEGQRKLRAAHVAVIGAGALGSAAATYLAAAGVGRLTIVDGDRVDLSNLHRQILHTTQDVGLPKVTSAAARLTALNPEIEVVPRDLVLTASNALEVLADCDLIVNGTDNFPTRYLLSDAAVMLKKPLVDAALLRFEGQLAVFMPGQGCYRCLFPSPPPPGSVPSCAEAGVLGAVAGVLGAAEAIEAIKVAAGLGGVQTGRLLLYDAWSATWQAVSWSRNPECPVCGDHPTLGGLIDYEAFCGVPVPSVPDATGSPWTVSPETARDMMEAGAALVDVRTAEEVRTGGHIPGAVLCPLDALTGGGAATVPSGPVVVVCTLGIRSAAAASQLRRQGVKAYNLEGGVVAWLNAGLPWQAGDPKQHL